MQTLTSANKMIYYDPYAGRESWLSLLSFSHTALPLPFSLSFSLSALFLFLHIHLTSLSLPLSLSASFSLYNCGTVRWMSALRIVWLCKSNNEIPNRITFVYIWRITQQSNVISASVEHTECWNCRPCFDLKSHKITTTKSYQALPRCHMSLPYVRKSYFIWCLFPIQILDIHFTLYVCSLKVELPADRCVQRSFF